jgi:hypothetical protein
VKKFILIILVLFISIYNAHVHAQNKKPQIENLPKFDRESYHFGFVLSVNTSNVRVDFKEQILQDTNLIAINNSSRPGFNLGMVASLDLSPNWHLRFVPTLTFDERALEYTFLLDNGQTETIDKSLNSTYIDFPLFFKYRTNRMTNVAPYVLLGGQFSIDVASQKDVNNAISKEVVVKLNNYNWSVITGLGIDFFLPYFKFGIELKIDIGVSNILVDDNTIYSAPLKSLKSQSVMLSFTFEG